MIIYGTAIVAFCYFAGTIIGELLGKLLGVSANVGGVGFGMLLLLFVTEYILPEEKIHRATRQGITFWQGMYLSITIAMAASQNVFQALNGGMFAILAGLLAVGISISCLPLLSRLTKGRGFRTGEQA